MKLFSFEDLPEGFRYPDAIISSGSILQAGTRKDIGHYLVIKIPLPFKKDFDSFGDSRRVIRDWAVFTCAWCTDFLPVCMEYPRDRFAVLLLPKGGY